MISKKYTMLWFYVHSLNGCQVRVPLLDKWLHIYGTKYHHLRDAQRM